MILFLYLSSQYNTKVEQHGVGAALSCCLGFSPNPSHFYVSFSCHYVAQASLELRMPWTLHIKNNNTFSCKTAFINK